MQLTEVMTANVQVVDKGTSIRNPQMLAAALLAVLGLLTTASAQQLNDQSIQLAVSEELVEDPGVAAHRVDVSVEDGVVTLDGSVDNALAKDRAVKIAETVKGVRSVVNTINVAAPPRPDSEIREDVEQALLSDPVAESWELDISVEDGVVTLDGVVDSWQEKELAVKTVRGVRGVTAVLDEVTWSYEEQRPDAEIEAEIAKALRWNVLVDDALINVAVDDGEAVLSGSLGSLAEKRQAETTAWVSGVTSVDAAQLTVESWARDERFRKDKYVEKPDEAIEQAVSDALLYDPRVTMFSIDVSVEDGVATLTGTVDNLNAKRSAAQDARNTLGVWRVKNQIRVRPEDVPSDMAIENDVIDALRRSPYVSRYEIDVDVVNGQVYLTGEVDSFFEKAEADDVASNVEGVAAVTNNLAVDDDVDVLTYDPYVDEEWYVFDYDWHTYPARTSTTRNDWEILEDIRDEMFWSPFVDSDEVTVRVNEGVARLKGVVDTWNERAAATENAYEGGAAFVLNDLKVKYGPEYYRP